MDVDLMELADCGSPERLIGSVLNSNPNIKIPVPIEILAHAVGIDEIDRVAADGFEGSLVTNPEKSFGIIAVNEKSSCRRQRFTIAHEIGHFLIPTHTGDSHCGSDDLSVFNPSNPSARREAEANRFAAGILMPAPYFKRDMDKLGDPDLIHIVKLADHYQASLEATVNRYIEFTDYSCAIIFSHNGRIRYPRPTKNFPWTSVTKGRPLPSESLSVEDSTSTREKPTDWREVSGEIWLATNKHGEPLPSVLEQTMRLRGGYRITLLQVEANDDEFDDDAELEESWTPRLSR